LNLGAGDAAVEFYATYLSLSLIVGDVDGARYLWKRLPSALKNGSPELGALWGIGKGLLARDFVGLKAIFGATQWTHAQPFVAEIRGAIEARQLREVAQSYSVISAAALAEELMAGSVAEAVGVARAHGWDVSDAGDYIRPRALPDGSNGNSSSNSNSSSSSGGGGGGGGNGGDRGYENDMQILHKLAAYVAHFEKRALKIDVSSASTASVTGAVTGAVPSAAGGAAAAASNA
jgi:hypothetical protein